MPGSGPEQSAGNSKDKPRKDPARMSWREGSRTRADELSALSTWIETDFGTRPPGFAALHLAIRGHLEAVHAVAVSPRGFIGRGAKLERAISNLDAAEAHLLRVAPAAYVLGQMPSVLNHVQRHLQPGDPRRREVEAIAKQLGVNEPGPSPPWPALPPVLGESVKPSRWRAKRRGGKVPVQSPVPVQLLAPLLRIVDEQRGQIVSAMRAAGSAALREQNRLRSFRNVVVVTAAAMFVVAVVLGLIGLISPNTIPLCFAPEEGGQTRVVCPTEQSGPVATPGSLPEELASFIVPRPDIDTIVRATVAGQDILVVEVIGLTAAGISAASAIRQMRGSSEPYGVPIALALLKLPTGAVTAFLGLLLMRGQFVPGLSALDTSAQILAWAGIFGYAQQLFTRLVDQQAHSVLDDVRGGKKGKEPDRSA
jgi:hypothetical protein